MSINRELIQLCSRNLAYLDVGARGGINSPWRHYSELLTIIGFEPDLESYNQLVSQKKHNELLFPYALSNSIGTEELNLTKSRGSSSFFKPNFNFLKHFPDHHRFEIDKTVQLETTTIDHLVSNNEIQDIDFIKLDTQGSEIKILEGGKSTLSNNIVGIELEVEFQPMYEGQPLFSDVDRFVRDTYDLQLQDLKKTYWKHPSGINIGYSKGQIVFGDALYFRPASKILEWASNFPKVKAKEKVEMAILMGVIYGYLDYSLYILDQKNILEFVDPKQVFQWKKLIRNYGKNHKLVWSSSHKIALIFNLLMNVFRPDHLGWGHAGQHLGTRKKWNIFY